MGAEDEERAAAPRASEATPTGKQMPPVGVVLGGRFQLEAELGRGGTGVVFRAFDRVMGEPVAVKLLFPERAADEGWVRRLVREVKVARTIVHPNVRRIFEIGRVDGYWLITMELGTGALGESARGRRQGADVERGLRPWAERREDARAVVDGLAAIHAAGITHRDVTPNNVLRMADGRLVLSDFGLALLDGETTALIAGTPRYVAPEVLTGTRPDQRSDVWQLGLVLHEIVFERPPLWRSTGGSQELLPPQGIDAVTPVDDLMRILRACLSVDPERRAATAVAIAEAFEGAIAGTRRELRARRRATNIVRGALALAGGVALSALVVVRLSSKVERGTVAPAPVASTPSAPPIRVARRIHVHLNSRPTQARVVDVATSEVWGSTPLDLDRAPSARTFTLRLSKPHFESASITSAATATSRRPSSCVPTGVPCTGAPTWPRQHPSSPSRRRRRTSPKSFDVRLWPMADRRRLSPTLLLMLAFAACSGPRQGKPFERGAGFVAPKPPPLIRLARAGTGACPGFCPTYSVEVDVEGGVAYTGVIHVKTIGPATGHLSADALAQLRAVMAKASQAKLPTERCACGCVKDTAIVTLTTWDKGVAKAAGHEEGCERAPRALRVLEDAVDELVGSERWTGTIQQRRLCFEEQRDCSGFGTPEPTLPDAGR